MKVMMIDPWGINNISNYINGLCYGIADYVDLTLVTNYYYRKNSTADYEVRRLFFRISERKSSGRLRRLIRGIEYAAGYLKILRELKKKKYDVVHIQWFLQYKLDIFFIKRLRKHCPRLIYTAHNVLPHVNGEKYIDDIREILKYVDKVIVHGEGIRAEFEEYFGEFREKLVIQRHGTYLNQQTGYQEEVIPEKIRRITESYDRIYIFFGNMFFNKGVDRLVRIWLDKFRDSPQLLIIAGRKNPEYAELSALEDEIQKCENILYITPYVDDNLLNYLIHKSNIILLPYRHASMSGVVFTAAEFKKTILCTDTGSIAEYIINDENSFMVANDDNAYAEKLEFISKNIDNEELARMGERLYSHITESFSWTGIGKKLVEDAYK